MKKSFFILGLSFMLLFNSYAQQLAFPSAEGYGKFTKGGRGGVVYEVTNLNDSGEGSLRAAVEEEGPRTVVFRVSGTITLNSNLTISNPYITIAGQTAPGDGICLRKYALVIKADEVIIRHLRVRYGDEAKEGRRDAVSARYVKNIILDHVSASWSGDEVMSIYHCENITVQWCMITESIGTGGHRFAGIWGSNYGTYHHNLIAHHVSRNPRMASGCGNTDYRNNVVYNWGANSTYGGEKAQPNKEQFNFSNINVVANYYKPGPATEPGATSHCIVDPWSRNGTADYGKWYVADNVVDGNAWVSANNWMGGVQPKDGSEFIPVFKLDQPWEAMPIKQQTAEEAYASVLENAGATLPRRDPLNARIVDEVRNGNATYEGVSYEKRWPVADSSKKCGIIDNQADVGGWPELKSEPAPKDTDHDGMPDEWEDKNNLDNKDPDDRNTISSDGYTMLEKYINSII